MGFGSLKRCPLNKRRNKETLYGKLNLNSFLFKGGFVAASITLLHFPHEHSSIFRLSAKQPEEEAEGEEEEEETEDDEEEDEEELVAQALAQNETEASGLDNN